MSTCVRAVRLEAIWARHEGHYGGEWMSLVCVLESLCVLAVNQPWISYIYIHTILGAAGGASMVWAFIKLWCRSAGSLPSFNFRRQEMVNSTVPGVAASLVRRKPGKLLRSVHCEAPRRTYSLCKTWNLKTLAMTDILLILLTILGYNVEEVQILSSYPPRQVSPVPRLRWMFTHCELQRHWWAYGGHMQHLGFQTQPLCYWASQPAPRNVVNVPPKKYSKALSSFPW